MADKEKTLLFSVSAADCIRQTFRAGGKGGQYQNKTESAVRFIHPPSGARGESRDARDQKTNAREAFSRMVATKEFKNWHRVETARRLGQPVRLSDAEIRELVDRRIEEDLANGLIVEEVIPRQPYETGIRGS